jgi:hypothetical protein
MSSLIPVLAPLGTVSQLRSWFENVTTNGIGWSEFKSLSVRPERVEGLRSNWDTVSRAEMTEKAT